MRDLYHGFSDTVYRISFWTFIPTNTTFLHKYSNCNRKLNSIIHLVAYKFSPSKEGGGGEFPQRGPCFLGNMFPLPGRVKFMGGGGDFLGHRSSSQDLGYHPGYFHALETYHVGSKYHSSCIFLVVIHLQKYFKTMLIFKITN